MRRVEQKKVFSIWDDRTFNIEFSKFPFLSKYLGPDLEFDNLSSTILFLN